MSSALSGRKITQLKTEFLALDDNGDGTISASELRKCLMEVKQKLNKTDKDIDRILNDFDKNGDGIIEVNEFLEGMANKKNQGTVLKAITNRSLIRKQFKKFDKNKDGYINSKEFKICLERTLGSLGI